MAVCAPTSPMVSSTDRALPVRRRPEVEVYAQRFQGRPCWVIKDPVSLQYFRLQEEEYLLWQMLDGRHSLEQMQKEFAKRFRPRSIRTEEIQRFVAMLHQAGLVLSDRPGQAAELYRQAQQRRRWRWLAGASNLLAIRFRGINPDPLLDWLLPYVGWLFSPAAVWVGCLMILLALVSVLVYWEQFVARLPEMQTFFHLSNIPTLMVVLAGMKVCHELGHGLVCKRLGGCCTELGLMLLLFTPCLYCNVSDAWLWKNKWHRAAVSAAGIYVELVLASLATFLWWWTEPGLLQQLALAAMVLGSVNTVLVNGNPLLRYDGYYLLADLLETPNLQQKASSLLGRLAGRWLLGLPEPEDRFLPDRYRGWFLLYGLAAGVYRWLILAGVLWFLWRALEPVRLQVIGQALAGATLVGLVGWPGYRLVRFFTTPGASGRIDRRRAMVSLTGLGVLVLAALAIPLPHYVTCPVEIRPSGATPVYVEVPGRLVTVLARPGQWVQAGQLLVELQNPEAQLDIARLEAMRDEYQLRVQTTRWQQVRDPEAAAQLRQLEEALRSVEEQLAKRREDLGRLKLVAPKAGMVFASPRKEPEGLDADGQTSLGRLPSWSGTPLDSQNLGAWLAPGTLLCLIADPAQMEAVLFLDQTDVKLVLEGQPVKILLNAYPDRVIRRRQTKDGSVELTIAELSRSEMDPASWAAESKTGRLPRSVASPEKYLPNRPKYQARVLLDNPDGLLQPGLTGLARIRTENLCLAHRLWRLVCQTFRLE
ncbi:MAG: biotin/lipoyl-binding protein [Thermoguttaceae bacterium]|nr:biotin/lipoyl-binding protein [Thermoguttaceae bacterium]MDW8037733.1 PqqD family peptide modification chaperone [Thermoguttaceae bacterium]